LSNTKACSSAREMMFAELMANGCGGSNARFVAAMMASWYHGEGVLPAYMGLTPDLFKKMAQHFFPGVGLPALPDRTSDWQQQMPEFNEMHALLAAFSADNEAERGWIAAIAIAGCLGHKHLWEDLGLFNRPDLTAMIAENFPELAAKNVRDMKWKKFIYKQLCEREGIIACPAPTCDACADFSICFASEEEPSQTG